MKENKDILYMKILGTQNKKKQLPFISQKNILKAIESVYENIHLHAHLNIIIVIFRKTYLKTLKLKTYTSCLFFVISTIIVIPRPK
jgi:hypothetical protein